MEKVFFSVRTKNADSVGKILAKDNPIEMDGINVLEDRLSLGQPTFIVLGGDKPSWDTGLIGLGKIAEAPYDKGYSGKNFKIKINVDLLLPHAVKREDLVPYRDTYGIIGIGPITKWEPNQALSRVENQKAMALLRAMMELYPEIADDLRGLVSDEEWHQITGPARKMIEVPMNYGQDAGDAVQDYLRQQNADTPVKYRTDLRTEKEYPYNWIVFGAPGTGKSYHLEEARKGILQDEKIGGYERVTFHPDYSYAQFVGTYKPVSEGRDIYYRFVPGPFMRVYAEALKNGRTDNPQPYVLLIEEINRANVAAVFGDVFQLLDRDEDGVSQYEIEASEDIRKYLAEQLGGRPENYTKIRIPNNMFIWATMNSADQGVFPMDTAFKRRWDFTYIGVNDNDAEIAGKTVEMGSGSTRQRVEWNRLRMAINDYLAGKGINEDKQLGPYFLARNIVVPESGTETDSERFCTAFKNKVIMYLFEDAARRKRQDLFKGCFDGYSRYSEICREFDEKGIGIFNEIIQKKADPVDLGMPDPAEAPSGGETV